MEKEYSLASRLIAYKEPTESEIAENTRSLKRARNNLSLEKGRVQKE